MVGRGVRPGKWRRWPVFLLSSLAAVSVFLHVAGARRRHDIRRLREEYASLVKARPIDETKTRRARFYQTRFFLAYPTAVSHATAHLIQRIGLIAPPLRLLTAQVDPGLQDLGFELTVGVAAASQYAAQRSFTVFFARMGALPGIAEISYSDGGRQDGLRLFVVRGRVELS